MPQCKHDLELYETDEGLKGCAYCYPPSAEDIALVDALVADELREDKAAARAAAHESDLGRVIEDILAED